MMEYNEKDESNRKLRPCQKREIYQFAWAQMVQNTLSRGRIEVLGPRHLQIYKIRLPFDATNVFDKIIKAYNEFDRQRANDCFEGTGPVHPKVGSLYSLTKRDVAVVDLPGHIFDLVQNIQSYVVSAIQYLFHIPSNHRVYMDRHQPHVLKYDASTDRSLRSVPLHHDCCHVTANMVINSRALQDYEGGGTYFLELNETIFCEPNEFIIHPGYSVHSGLPITSGSRFLLISFINFVP